MDSYLVGGDLLEELALQGCRSVFVGRLERLRGRRRRRPRRDGAASVFEWGRRPRAGRRGEGGEEDAHYFDALKRRNRGS